MSPFPVIIPELIPMCLEAREEMQLERLEQEVFGWAHEKGIFEKSDGPSQMGKMVEEVGELGAEVLLSIACEDGNKENIKNELGDVLVTCVIQAKFHGLSLQECLQAAYNKISKRTGRMINGQFVKDN